MQHRHQTACWPAATLCAMVAALLLASTRYAAAQAPCTTAGEEFLYNTMSNLTLICQRDCFFAGPDAKDRLAAECCPLCSTALNSAGIVIDRWFNRCKSSSIDLPTVLAARKNFNVIHAVVNASCHIPPSPYKPPSPEIYLPPSPSDIYFLTGTGDSAGMVPGAWLHLVMAAAGAAMLLLTLAAAS
uniref:Uncharacterized protein n=1 Tax=Chlamydomonas leiostraca TaxID=1034604 RepID=A0A7S0R3H6_9CHLO|mmetsp:Transcript_12995/g.31822  ORF Transcript_12995/g.31822 Transcript_12995/m.31822 type:complete len:186 (+) Transcript_12995:94-651(+)